MDERKRPTTMTIVKQQLQLLKRSAASITNDIVDISEQQRLPFGVLMARDTEKTVSTPLFIEYPAMYNAETPLEQSNGQMLLAVPEPQKIGTQQKVSRREILSGLLGTAGVIVIGGDIAALVGSIRSNQTNVRTNVKWPMKPDNLDFAQGIAGWFLAGSSPQDYEYGSEARNLGASGYLKSRTLQANGFGTLMQAFKGSEYLGKRLRLSASVKTQGVEQWVGLWMRVDDADGKTLSFDNMQGRPIRGTTNWQQYEIVLDVPQEGVGIYFGVLLEGVGHAWLSNVHFETVSGNVPTTGS
jgi:hypothetical protein